MTVDYEAILLEHYRTLIRDVGPRDSYPKSHWEGCERVGRTSAVMPAETPAEWISCNTCLINGDYIRIVQCDPRLPGWPDTQCDICEYGNDHETWLRVKGVGEGVEKALRRHIDPDAEHPVTWADVGLVPFLDGPNPEFDNKSALDDYWAELQARIKMQQNRNEL